MVFKGFLDGGGCRWQDSVTQVAHADLEVLCRFIIDGIITLPVAVYGFLLFPGKADLQAPSGTLLTPCSWSVDTPRNTRGPYLSAEEKALAISRVPEVSERTPISWNFLKHCFGTWYWYMFVILWILAGETESFSTNALLQLYMKSHPTNKYTISQVNNYPTGVPAVGIISTLFWATLTDFMGGKRYLGKAFHPGEEAR